nr:sugar carrier protein A [Tanacetum cinerariifolium]
MIAIMEKYEHNVKFHQIVDFVEASHIRYALTINPTVYVSHIRQFWSTARIETTDEGTKILATVDGKSRTISESSIRRNLKLKDEEGISSLPDAELFENLALMGVYNFSKMIFDGMVRNVNNKGSKFLMHPSPSFSGRIVPLFATMLVTQGEGSGTPTEPYHTPSSKAQQSSHNAPLDRENIIKTSALPHDSTPRVTSLAADEGSMQQQLYELTDLCTHLQRIKLLADKDKGTVELSRDDAPIKGRSLETEEEAGIERSTERGSNDTEELINVLTSLDTANILTSGVQAVSVPSVIEIPTVGIPIGSGMVPTISPIFTTASMVTPYSRRKAREMEEQMAREDQRRNEQIARDAEIARIHAEEELKMMIDGLDRSNEVIVRDLYEYEQSQAELTIGEKIELINNLVKYQNHHAKILKEKFILVWKQIEEFVPMASKEEGERVKKKGLRLEQESAKKMETLEEVSEEDLKDMMQLVPVEERNYWKIIRLGGHTAVYQFFGDMLNHFDKEDLNQLWTLVKKTLSIRQASSDKENELWVKLKRLFEPDFKEKLWTHTQALMHDPLEWKLYDTCGVHHIFTRDQEIFMLAEKDYPLRRGLAIVMISNKLQWDRRERCWSEVPKSFTQWDSFASSGGAKDKAQQYQGKVTTYVIIACVVAAIGGSIFGYDIGISGGVTSMDAFLIKFFPSVYEKKKRTRENNYCKFNDQGLSAFTSSLYLSGLVATLFASPVTRIHGRRISIIFGGISFLVGAALNATAVNFAMLLLGRIMFGIGIGFGNQAIPLYLSEMAPTHLRGGLNMMFQLATTLGIFSANMINYKTSKLDEYGWRLSLGLAAAPALLMTVGGMLLPETPNSLIQQGSKEKGRKVLERIRGTPNVDAEFKDMVDASDLANSIKHPFRNILKKRNRPQLVMAVLMPMFQILTGINSILFYAPVLFQSMGFKGNASLYSSALTGAVLFLSTVVSIATVDKLGRRVLLISGGIQMIICQVIVGIILGLKFGNDQELSKGYSIVVVVVICLFVAAYGWSWGPLGWTVPSEIFPLETRSAGQSITVAVNLFFTFIIAQSFLSLLCGLKDGLFAFIRHSNPTKWHSVDKLFDEADDPEQEHSVERDDDVLEETITKDVSEVAIEKTKNLALKGFSLSSGIVEPRDDRPVDSVSRPKLQTCPPSKRYVISSDDSYHSDSRFEVNFFARSIVADTPVMAIAITTTVGGDASIVQVPKDKVRSENLETFGDSASASEANMNAASSSKLNEPTTSSECFYASPDLDSKTLQNIYVPKCKVTNDSVLDDPFLSRFNGPTAYVSGSEKTEATEAIHLRSQLTHDMSGFQLSPDKLSSKVAFLESKRDGLADQSSLFESAFELFKECMKAMQDEQATIMGNRVAELDAQILEMAAHLDEEFYPHFLTTISGQRWILTHRLKLILLKCLQSSESLQALRKAIGCTVNKGIQGGLKARVDHGKAGRDLSVIEAYDPSAEAKYIDVVNALGAVDFSLLSELKSKKDQA